MTAATDLLARVRAAREEIARVIADQIGDGFDNAHADKRDWTATRGEKAGRFRDVNEPRQSDYLNAADGVIALLAALVEEDEERNALNEKATGTPI